MKLLLKTEEKTMLQITINNLLVKARQAMLNNDFKKAGEIYDSIAKLANAIEIGETEKTAYGAYLIKYAKRF